MCNRIHQSPKHTQAQQGTAAITDLSTRKSSISWESQQRQSPTSAAISTSLSDSQQATQPYHKPATDCQQTNTHPPSTQHQATQYQSSLARNEGKLDQRFRRRRGPEEFLHQA